MPLLPYPIPLLTQCCVAEQLITQIIFYKKKCIILLLAKNTRIRQECYLCSLGGGVRAPCPNPWIRPLPPPPPWIRNCPMYNQQSEDTPSEYDKSFTGPRPSLRLTTKVPAKVKRHQFALLFVATN